MRHLRYLKHQDKLWMPDEGQGAGGAGVQQGPGGAGVQAAVPQQGSANKQKTIKRKTINFSSFPTNKKLYKIVPGVTADTTFEEAFQDNVDLINFPGSITKEVLAKAVYNSKNKKPKDHTELNRIRNFSSLIKTNPELSNQISSYNQNELSNKLNEEYNKIEQELIDFDRETNKKIVEESKNLKLHHNKINQGASVKTKYLKEETRGVDAINKGATAERTRLSAKLALIRHFQYFDNNARGSKSKEKIIKDMNKHLGSIQDPKGLRGGYLIGQTANKISTTQLEALKDMAKEVEAKLKIDLSNQNDNNEKKKINENIQKISDSYQAFEQKIIAIKASGNNEADMDFSLLMQIDELRKDQEMFNKEQQKIMEECSSLTGDTYVTTGALWKLIKKMREEAKKKGQTKIFVTFLSGVKIGEKDFTEAIMSYKEGVETYFTRQLSDGRTVSMELGDYSSYADWKKTTKSKKYSNNINLADKSQSYTFTFGVYKVIEKGNEAIILLKHDYKKYLNDLNIKSLDNLKVFDYNELKNAAKKDRFSLSNTNARENITKQITENQDQLANLNDIRTAIDKDIATKTTTFETTEQAYNTASRTLESKKEEVKTTDEKLKLASTQLTTSKTELQTKEEDLLSAAADMVATNRAYINAQENMKTADQEAKRAHEGLTAAQEGNPEAQAAAQARLDQASTRVTQAKADHKAAEADHKAAKGACNTAKTAHDKAQRARDTAQEAHTTAQAEHTAAKTAHTAAKTAHTAAQKDRAKAKKGLDVAKGAKNAVEKCNDAFKGNAAKNAIDGLNKGQPIHAKLLIKAAQNDPKISKDQTTLIESANKANDSISSRVEAAAGANNGNTPSPASKSPGN